MTHDSPIYNEIMNNGTQEPMDHGFAKLMKEIKAIKPEPAAERQDIVNYAHDCLRHIQSCAKNHNVPLEEIRTNESSTLFDQAARNPERNDDVTRLLNLDESLNISENQLMISAMQYGSPIEIYNRPRMPRNLREILDNTSTVLNSQDIAEVTLQTELKR